MKDDNGKLVFEKFKERFGIILQKISVTPKHPTPDVTFDISGHPIIAEIKTIENPFRVNLDVSKFDKNEEGFFEYEEMTEDNTESKVARAIEKVCKQLLRSEVRLKSVIILNKFEYNLI